MLIAVLGIQVIWVIIMQAHQLWLSDAEAVTGYEHTGCSGSMFANRLSWTFDLRGPSKAIDTACSSSLTALVGHQGYMAKSACAASVQPQLCVGSQCLQLANATSPWSIFAGIFYISEEEGLLVSVDRSSPAW